MYKRKDTKFYTEHADMINLFIHTLQLKVFVFCLSWTIALMVFIKENSIKKTFLLSTNIDNHSSEQRHIESFFQPQTCIAKTQKKA